MTGRFATRSIHAPAGSPISSHGSHAAAVSRLTVNAPASSTCTAISGVATPATELPSRLTVMPAHSLRKAASRTTPRALTAAPGSPG